MTAVLLALLAAQASPQPAAADTKHYLQCFLAVSELAGADEAEVKEMGMMGALFFAGQVFGSNPGIDLPAAVKAEARTLTPTAMAALRVQCGGEMQKRGIQIQDAGKALETDPPSSK